MEKQQESQTSVRTVGVIGAGGFVGRALSPALADHGIVVTGFSRRPEGKSQPGVAEWRASEGLDVAGLDAVVNLAGEPIDQRWTRERRLAFDDSRAGLTGRLVDSIGCLPEGGRPKVLVNASAVGIYGDRGDELLDESAVPGSGFLEDICIAWEQAALRAEALGLRVVCLRIGVVFGRGGGAFEKLRKVFACGIGGRLGNGRQWTPWIHLADLVGAIVFALGDGRISGPVNGSSPGPERNADLTRKLASALRRPALLPVPALALKLAMGGFGEVLLASQRVAPQALEQAGFEFRFPGLEGALEELLDC